MIRRIALTPGEPAGIGPDVCLQVVQQPLPAEVVVVGSPDLLAQRAKLLSLKFDWYEFDPNKSPTINGEGRIAMVPVALTDTCSPGELNVTNSKYVLETLRKAFHLCQDKQCDALTTGPVSKAIINQSGVRFSGHTEFFGQLAGVSDILMMFVTPQLIIGLVTAHCPLIEVSAKLTPERLSAAISLLHKGLVHLFNKPHPKISICGLNPHAGEMGYLGTEEQKIMIPVIQELQFNGLDLVGPVPADTVFAPHHRAEYDAILAMYHDQGLTPLKALYFKEVVNITLGLPFIRTSVDHGIALTLAGKGSADPTALRLAIEAATKYA